MVTESEPQRSNRAFRVLMYVNLGLALGCFMAAFLANNPVYAAGGAVLLVVHQILVLRMK